VVNWWSNPAMESRDTFMDLHLQTVEEHEAYPYVSGRQKT